MTDHRTFQLHPGHNLPDRRRRFGRTGNYPRVEELIRPHQSYPVRNPFSRAHPPLFREGPFQCKLCMPLLAQSEHSTRRTMDPDVPEERRGLRDDSPRTRKRVPAEYSHPP